MKYLVLLASTTVLTFGNAYAYDDKDKTRSISYNGVASSKTVDTDGDVEMNGAAIALKGRVGGDVDMNGASINLNVEVGGDLEVNGAAVEVEADVLGDTLVNGGAVSVEGRYNGKVHVNGGSVSLDGEFSNQVSSNFGAFEFSGEAQAPVNLSGKQRRGFFRRGDRSEVSIAGHLAAGGEICAHEVEFENDAKVSGPLVIYADDEPKYPDGFDSTKITYTKRETRLCDDI